MKPDLKTTCGINGDYTGRYIHWGIREHAMASISNGLAAFNKGTIIPITSTFFMFYLVSGKLSFSSTDLPLPFLQLKINMLPNTNLPTVRCPWDSHGRPPIPPTNPHCNARFNRHRRRWAHAPTRCTRFPLPLHAQPPLHQTLRQRRNRRRLYSCLESH